MEQALESLGQATALKRVAAGAFAFSHGRFRYAVLMLVMENEEASVSGSLFSHKALAMTYFLTGNPQYHRRNVVSRSCSEWEGVGPTRYGRQEFGRRVGNCTGRHAQFGKQKVWVTHCLGAQGFEAEL